MPEPTKGESKNNFLNRCMADPEAIATFSDQAQRYAFCNSTFLNKETIEKAIENAHMKVEVEVCIPGEEDPEEMPTMEDLYNWAEENYPIGIDGMGNNPMSDETNTKWVRTKQGMLSAIRWAFNQDKSEGLIARSKDKKVCMRKQIVGENPNETETEPSRIRKDYYTKIMMANNEKQIVVGVVLEPETEDAHGDIISAEEIEKTAHFFMAKSRTIGDSHKQLAEAEVVESYIAPVSFVINGERVKEGTWLMSVHILDKNIWDMVKSGYYTGFSIGGYGVREADNKDAKT